MLHQPTLATALLCAALFTTNQVGAQGLASFGPLDPNNGFPRNYVDDNGRSLDLCQLNSGLCILDAPVSLTNPGQPFPANYGGTFPEESFWFLCEADMPTSGTGSAFLRLAIEQAFANGVVAAGDQVSFARVRIRVDNLIAGATYNCTTPVGVFSLVAANAGQRGINFTVDVGLVPGDFSGALNGAIGPFLTWDSDLPVLDVQGRRYIGNPNIAHRITGSATGTNFFRIDGPSVGGQGVNRIQTDLFLLAGLESQVVQQPGAPLAAFSSAPNSGTPPLNVSFTDQSTGTITSRLWNFGDGTTSAVQNPSHAYGVGTFTVSLTVTGPGGTDTETKPNLISVAQQPPANQLTLAAPTPGTAGVQNTFRVTGATPGAVVGVYSGLALGSSTQNLGNCGAGILIGLSRPFTLIGKATANAAGVATILVNAPATSAGKRFHFQAVEPSRCRTSSVVTDVF